MPIDDAFIEKINSYWKSKYSDQSKRSGSDFATVLYLMSKGASENSVRKLFDDTRFKLSEKYQERLKQSPYGARAYLDMTVSKASKVLQVRTDGEDLSQYRLDSITDGRDRIRVVPNELLKPLNLPGILGLTILSGPPKVTKSWFGLAAARDGVLAGSKVLILDFENGGWRTRRRLLKIFPEYQKYMDRLFYWSGKEFSINKLQNLILKLGVDLVVIDPIQKMSRNADNYFGELRQALGYLEDIKKEGDVAFLGISQIKREEYDQSSMGSGFGSNAIEYNSDLLLTIRRGSDSIRLIVLASRDYVPKLPSIKVIFGDTGLEIPKETEVPVNREQTTSEMAGEVKGETNAN